MASQIAVTDQPNWKPFKMPKEKKRYALPKQSEKRVSEDREYYAKRREYLNEHPVCEFEGCTKVASDLHHKSGRGKHYLDEATFCALCRNHHRFVTENGREAEALGFVVRRYDAGAA